MRHVTRYRIYPSQKVEGRLFTGFARCAFVRNWCLENKVYQDSCLPKLKAEYPELKEVHSKVLQNVVQQIVHNLRALRKLKEKGRKVGKLRKKGVHSMIYEQSGFKLTGNRLWLSKIGELRIELSRPVPGRIKQIVVKHTPAHKWFVAIISETPDTPELTTGTRAVGIDLNLENFSTDTEGMIFSHPHNVRKAAKRLRCAQRKLSRAVDGSRNRRKQRVRVARIHEPVENRRNDFLHKWSRYYVDRYDYIALEHLNIKPMVESLEAKLRGRSKSLLDAAWYKAREFIRYKARECWYVCASDRSGLHDTGLFPLRAPGEERPRAANPCLSGLRLHGSPGPERRAKYPETSSRRVGHTRIYACGDRGRYTANPGGASPGQRNKNLQALARGECQNQRIFTQGICFSPSALHYQAAGLVENSRAPPDAGPAVPGTRSGHNLRYDLPSSGAPGSLQQPYRDPP